VNDLIPQLWKQVTLAKIKKRLLKKLKQFSQSQGEIRFDIIDIERGKSGGWIR